MGDFSVTNSGYTTPGNALGRRGGGRGGGGLGFRTPGRRRRRRLEIYKQNKDGTFISFKGKRLILQKTVIRRRRDGTEQRITIYYKNPDDIKKFDADLKRHEKKVEGLRKARKSGLKGGRTHEEALEDSIREDKQKKRWKAELRTLLKKQ